MPTVIQTMNLHTFGLGLDEVGKRLGDLRGTTRNPSVGTLQRDGIVSIQVRSRASSFPEAQQRLEETVKQVQQQMGSLIFGRESQTLQDSLVALLKEKTMTVVTVESCTGGLIGKMITDVAGASDVYLGGWVAYADAMKIDQLGVPQSVIHQHGAVSGPVARALADAAIQRSGADLSVAVTGVAGPDGGSPDKPVGTVWIALGGSSTPDQPVTGQTMLVQLGAAGADRATIRDRAAKYAIQGLRLAALNESIRLLSAPPA